MTELYIHNCNRDCTTLILHTGKNIYYILKYKSTHEVHVIASLNKACLSIAGEALKILIRFYYQDVFFLQLLFYKTCTCAIIHSCILTW